MVCLEGVKLVGGEEAAVLLDRILAGALGVSLDFWGVVDAKELDGVRAEARRRGYGP